MKTAKIYKENRQAKMKLVKKETGRTRFPENLTDQKSSGIINNQDKTKGDVRSG